MYPKNHGTVGQVPATFDAVAKKVASSINTGNLATDVPRCADAALATMKSDHANEYQQWLSQGATEQNILEAFSAQCELLYRSGYGQPKQEEKKTNWLLWGGLGALAVGGVVLVASKAKDNPTYEDNPRGRPKKWYGAYEIVRMYQDANIPSRVIDVVPTLQAAQKHCRDPETSSKTATSKAAKARTRKYGPWFDGYQKHYESRRYDPPKYLEAEENPTKNIAEVDFDEAEYIGDGSDGVYVQAAEYRGKKHAKGWYVSGVVDSDTGSFVSALFTDDGPYGTYEKAMEAGRFSAQNWCLDNGVSYYED